MVAFPQYLVFPLAEFVTYMALVICAGKHLFTYLSVSKEAFSTVAPGKSRKSSVKDIQNMASFKIARRAKRNLGQNMVALFTLIILMGPALVLLSPVFQANQIREIDVCKQRSADDISNVEAMRFYVYHTIDAILIISTCHALFTLTAGQRRKRKASKSTSKGATAIQAAISPSRIFRASSKKRATIITGLQTETTLAVQPSTIADGSYRNGSSYCTNSSAPVSSDTSTT